MIKIGSSAGIILVTNEGEPISDLPPEYDNIVKFDIKRLERMCVSNHITMREEWDIVALGYWTDDGNYENPAPDYSEHGFMRHIWSGRADDYDEACEIEERESTLL